MVVSSGQIAEELSISIFIVSIWICVICIHAHTHTHKTVYVAVINIIYPLTNNAFLSLSLSFSPPPPFRAFSSSGPKTPVRFFRKAPKIYETCLPVPLRERGCRGGLARTERAGGTHACSLTESALSLQTTDARSAFSSSAPAADEHVLCRIVFWETKLFSSLSGCFPPAVVSPSCTPARDGRSDRGSPPRSAAICFGRCEEKRLRVCKYVDIEWEAGAVGRL